ncbi:MAG: HEAT repeat domain-containing protein [Candidatus Omnitrophica bacterium]|nr:HEAT repeat domain-containing protein [Candidatus Omnitrophota bacterium]
MRAWHTHNPRFSLRLFSLTLSFVFLWSNTVLLADPVSGLSGAGAAHVTRQAPRGSTPREARSLITVPPQLGQVVDSYVPSDRQSLVTSHQSLVIHIQDLHVQPEAQLALASLLHYLHEQYGVRLAALEGAAGPLNTAPFSSFPDPQINEKVARLFVKHGLFTGSECYAITHPGAMEMVGVEDEATYLDHLKTYRQGAIHAKRDNEDLTQLRKMLEALKPKLYSKALSQLDAQIAAYRDGHLKLERYLPHLMRVAVRAHLKRRDFPQVSRLALLYDLHRYGTDKHLRIYERINARLNGRQVWQEFEAFERALKDTLATTPEAQQLAAWDRWLGILDGLRRVKLTREDWNYYLAHKAQFTDGALRDFLDQHRRFLPATSHQSLVTGPHERFYSLALSRDAAFVSNTLSLLASLPATSHQSLVTPQRSCVLVTGGFHTPGITQRLREQGIAYVVVTPKVEGRHDERTYHARLSHQGPSLEAMLRDLKHSSLVPELSTGSAAARVSWFDGVRRWGSKAGFVLLAAALATAAYAKQAGWPAERIQAGLAQNGAIVATVGEDGQVQVALKDVPDSTAQLTAKGDVTLGLPPRRQGVRGQPHRKKAALSPNVTKLIQELRDFEPNTRLLAAKALGELRNRKTTPALLEASRDHNWPVRDQVVMALGQLKDRRAFARLVEALGDSQRQVRATAAWALGELGDSRAVLTLVAILRDPKDRDVDAAVAEALGKLGDRRAVPVLLQTLRHSYHLCRAKAAHALGRLGDRRALSALISALHDPHWTVSEAAPVALGKLDGLKTFPELATAVRSSDPVAREAATVVLIARLQFEKRPAVRLQIAELLDLDVPPVVNDLLDVAYVGHDMAVKAVVNPDNKPLVAVYGAAGTDISNFLLSTNATEAYFLDIAYDDTLPDKLQKSLQQWDTIQLRDRYVKHKQSVGHGTFPRFVFWNMDGAIIQELKAMGVDRQTIALNTLPGNYAQLRFTWTYPGTTRKKQYTVTFIPTHLDILDLPNETPQQLKTVLRQGIDLYYQRAALSLPESYDHFMPQIGAALKIGGYCLTDDHFPRDYDGSVDPRHHLETGGATFAEVSTPLQAELWEPVIEALRDRQVGPKGNWSRDYGWHVQIRKKIDATASRRGPGGATPRAWWLLPLVGAGLGWLAAMGGDATGLAHPSVQQAGRAVDVASWGGGMMRWLFLGVLIAPLRPWLAHMQRWLGRRNAVVQAVASVPLEPSGESHRQRLMESTGGRTRGERQVTIGHGQASFQHAMPWPGEVWIVGGASVFQVLLVGDRIRIERYRPEAAPIDEGEFAIGQRVFVGRSSANDVAVDDESLSREHFSLQVTRGDAEHYRVLIIDQSSLNHTTIFWDAPAGAASRGPTLRSLVLPWLGLGAALLANLLWPTLGQTATLTTRHSSLDTHTSGPAKAGETQTQPWSLSMEVTAKSRRQLIRFFKEEWPAFVRAHLINEGVEVADARVRQAMDVISPTVRGLLGPLIPFWSELDHPLARQVLALQWNTFTHFVLLPHGLYGTLSLRPYRIGSREGHYYDVDLYRVLRQEVARVSGQPVDVVYGRNILSPRLRRVPQFDTAPAHSIMATRIVFIDLDWVHYMAERIHDVVRREARLSYVREASAAVNGWIRQAYRGLRFQAIYRMVLQDLRRHEFTHKAQEYTRVRYQLTDRLGLPEETWQRLQEGERLDIEMETAAYLAELVLADRPPMILVYLWDHWVTGQRTPNYYAARYLYNRLANRPLDQWLDGTDRAAAERLFTELATAPDLPDRARRLYEEAFRGLPLVSPARQLAPFLGPVPTLALMRSANATLPFPLTSHLSPTAEPLRPPEGQAGHAQEVAVGGGEVAQAVRPHRGDMEGIVREESITQTEPLGRAELGGRDTHQTQAGRQQEIEHGVTGREVVQERGSRPEDVERSVGGGRVALADRLSQEQPVADLRPGDDGGHRPQLARAQAVEEQGAGGLSAQQMLQGNVGVEEEGRAGRRIGEPGHLLEEGVVVDKDLRLPLGDAKAPTRAADRVPRSDDRGEVRVLRPGQLAPGPQDTALIDHANRLGHQIPSSVSDSKNTVTASAMLDKASSIVSPWEAQPGRAGTDTENPPTASGSTTTANFTATHLLTAHKSTRPDGPTQALTAPDAVPLGLPPRRQATQQGRGGRPSSAGTQRLRAWAAQHRGQQIQDTQLQLADPAYYDSPATPPSKPTTPPKRPSQRPRDPDQRPIAAIAPDGESRPSTFVTLRTWLLPLIVVGLLSLSSGDAEGLWVAGGLVAVHHRPWKWWQQRFREMQRHHVEEALAAMVEATRDLDPRAPAPPAVEARLKGWRRRGLRLTAPPGGQVELKAGGRHTLVIAGLQSDRTYYLRPYWEPGFGLRTYLARRYNVVGYGLEALQRLRLSDPPQRVNAQVVVRAADVWQARRNRQERLRAMLQSTLGFDPQTSDPQALTTLQQQLAAFRDYPVRWTAPRGGRFSRTLPDGTRLQVRRGLKPGVTYAIRPWWEPGQGLRLDFISREETVYVRVSPRDATRPARTLSVQILGRRTGPMGLRNLMGIGSLISWLAPLMGAGAIWLCYLAGASATSALLQAGLGWLGFFAFPAASAGGGPTGKGPGPMRLTPEEALAYFRRGEWQPVLQHLFSRSFFLITPIATRNQRLKAILERALVEVAPDAVSAWPPADLAAARHALLDFIDQAWQATKREWVRPAPLVDDDTAVNTVSYLANAKIQLLFGNALLTPSISVVLHMPRSKALQRMAATVEAYRTKAAERQARRLSPRGGTLSVLTAVEQFVAGHVDTVISDLVDPDATRLVQLAGKVQAVVDGVLERYLTADAEAQERIAEGFRRVAHALEDDRNDIETLPPRDKHQLQDLLNRLREERAVQRLLGYYDVKIVLEPGEEQLTVTYYEGVWPRAAYDLLAFGPLNRRGVFQGPEQWVAFSSPKRAQKERPDLVPEIQRLLTAFRTELLTGPLKDSEFVRRWLVWMGSSYEEQLRFLNASRARLHADLIAATQRDLRTIPPKFDEAILATLIELTKAHLDRQGRPTPQRYALVSMGTKTTPDSDLDVMVVLPDELDPQTFAAFFKALTKAVQQVGLPVDVGQENELWRLRRIRDIEDYIASPVATPRSILILAHLTFEGGDAQLFESARQRAAQAAKTRVQSYRMALTGQLQTFSEQLAAIATERDDQATRPARAKLGQRAVVVMCQVAKLAFAHDAHDALLSARVPEESIEQLTDRGHLTAQDAGILHRAFADFTTIRRALNVGLQPSIGWEAMRIHFHRLREVATALRERIESAPPWSTPEGLLQYLVNQDQAPGGYFQQVLQEFREERYDEDIVRTATGTMASAYARILYHLVQHRWPLRGVRVLEVGAGVGTFVDVLQRLGAQATGLEPVPAFAAFAQAHGVSLVSGNLIEPPAPLVEQPFDITIGHWVLDALVSPRRPGGPATRLEEYAALINLSRLTTMGGFSLQEAASWDGLPFTEDEWALAGFEVVERTAGEELESFVVLRKVRDPTSLAEFERLMRARGDDVDRPGNATIARWLTIPGTDLAAVERWMQGLEVAGQPLTVDRLRRWIDAHPHLRRVFEIKARRGHTPPATPEQQTEALRAPVHALVVQAVAATGVRQFDVYLFGSVAWAPERHNHSDVDLLIDATESQAQALAHQLTILAHDRGLNLHVIFNDYQFDPEDERYGMGPLAQFMGDSGRAAGEGWTERIMHRIRTQGIVLHHAEPPAGPGAASPAAGGTSAERDPSADGSSRGTSDTQPARGVAESKDRAGAVPAQSPQVTLPEIYNRIAAKYADSWGDEVQAEVVQHRLTFLKLLADVAGPILDAGTGPGRDAAWFQHQGRDAVGVDVSSGMLREAQQRYPRLPLAQMDLPQLGVSDDSVAGVWDNASFHHLLPEAAAQALKEFHRVLHPGGLLFLRVKRGDGIEVQRDPAYPDEERSFRLYQEEELRQVVATHGFDIIESGVQLDSPTSKQPARNIEWVYLFARKPAHPPKIDTAGPGAADESGVGSGVAGEGPASGSGVERGETKRRTASGPIAWILNVVLVVISGAGVSFVSIFIRNEQRLFEHLLVDWQWLHGHAVDFFYAYIILTGLHLGWDYLVALWHYHVTLRKTNVQQGWPERSALDLLGSTRSRIIRLSLSGLSLLLASIYFELVTDWDPGDLIAESLAIGVYTLLGIKWISYARRPAPATPGEKGISSDLPPPAVPGAAAPGPHPVPAEPGTESKTSQASDTWPELRFHQHLLETGNARSKKVALDAIAQEFSQRPPATRDAILEVMLAQYRSEHDEAFQGALLWEMGRLGLHVPAIRNEVLTALRSVHRHLVEGGFSGLSLSREAIDPELLEALKGLLAHPEFAKRTLAEFATLIEEQRLSPDVLRHDPQFIQTLEGFRRSRVAAVRHLSNKLLDTLRDIPVEPDKRWREEATVLGQLMEEEAEQTRRQLPQLTPREMAELHAVIRQRGRLPRRFFAELFEEGKRVVFLGLATDDRPLTRLTEDILTLHRQAGLTHVALPVPSAEAGHLQQLIRGELPPTAWKHAADDAGPLLEREPSDIVKAEHFQRMVQQLHGRVQFILYGALGEELTRGAPKGQVALEARVGALEQVLYRVPDAKILVLGSLEQLAQEDTTDNDGSVVQLSIARRLREVIGQDKTASVMEVDQGGLAALEDSGTNNLGEFVERFSIPTSFGLEVQRTPLAQLRYYEGYSNTFGSAWDGIVFRKDKDDDPKFFETPEPAEPTTVGPQVPEPAEPVGVPSRIRSPVPPDTTTRAIQERVRGAQETEQHQ